MKPISEYTIYCTEAQTKKALELGASIEDFDPDRNNGFVYKGRAITYPTAEQMRGWLEERDIIEEIEVGIYESDKWTYIVHLKNKPARVNHTLYNSRKEATLAAIDAALEFIEEQNNKED